MLWNNLLNCYLCKILWFLLIFRKLITKSCFLQGFTLPGDTPEPLFARSYLAGSRQPQPLLVLRRDFDLHPKPLCPLQGRGLTAPPVALTLR